jgi:hypothetical protein
VANSSRPKPTLLKQELKEAIPGEVDSLFGPKPPKPIRFAPWPAVSPMSPRNPTETPKNHPQDPPTFPTTLPFASIPYSSKSLIHPQPYSEPLREYFSSEPKAEAAPKEEKKKPT